MGIFVAFTAVPTDLLRRLYADPENAYDLLEEFEATDPVCTDVDKAWDGLQFLLNAAKVPVPVSPTGFAGDQIDEECTLFGMTVEEVTDAAEHLRNTPFERLAPHFDPVAMSRVGLYGTWRDGDLAYLEPNYRNLVEFFDAAATAGQAAVMSAS